MLARTTGIPTEFDRQKLRLHPEPIARGVLAASARSDVSRLARSLARAGIDVCCASSDIAAAGASVKQTGAELVVAGADLLDRFLQRQGRRTHVLEVVGAPVLIIGHPSAAGARQLLLNPAIDFVAAHPTVLELRVRAQRLVAGRHGLREADGSGMELSQRDRQVSVDGRSVFLTETEFALLSTLMEAPGGIVTSATLVGVLRAHGSRCSDGSNVVPVYVSYLRRKLVTLGVRIRTHHGRGYAIELPSAREESSPPARRGRRASALRLQH